MTVLSVPSTRSAAPDLALADCTVVIPTYNECENITSLIDQVLAFPRFQVLVVDDNSPDGTAQLVEQHPAFQKRLTLLSRPGKQGLGTAYIAGFRQALANGAQFIFEMDADFSHNPAYLPSLLAATESGNDLTIGSRYVPGGGTQDWGAVRQVISRGGNRYARLILSLPVMDATGGYRCYRRAVLETLNLDGIHSNGYSFQIEMAYRTLRAGFRVGEVPIVFPDRRVGNSKMSRRIVFEAL
ncbi:MAG TPA: polyprenol monophosphomannose synthase, partial [Roseiflexaceae bacterium]|nr:polyprenol monophosphomannose synthase [Roseiflexaceae bacterium]